MPGYLFDTSALSQYMNPNHRHHSTAKLRIDAIEVDAFRLLSPITLAEIDFGIRMAEADGRPRLHEFRERFQRITHYPVLDITNHTAEAHAELKARLALRVHRKPKGSTRRWLEDWVLVGTEKRLGFDENDLWLCAQAKERDVILVTGDRWVEDVHAIDPEVRYLLTC